MKHLIPFLVIFTLMTQLAWAGRAKIDVISNDPYVSALVVDGDTGETLFEDHADTVIYPASVIKLMVLLIVLERIEQGSLRLDEMVQVTKEAAQMGGSQVYLDPKEQFPIEELLYALIIQSANDAAVALGTHVAGSKEGFVALMNQRAGELAMKNTRFHSVHGLPPSEGQKPDETTARDLAILSRELANKPETFKFTSAREREFRDGKFIMRTHNHLLKTVDGCDGFKTGYFKAAGFSIVTTAKRNGVRIIAIVLGSKDRKIRDAKASELLAKGFAKIVIQPEKADAKTKIVAAPELRLPQAPEKKPANEPFSGRDLIMFCLGFAACLVFCAVLAFFISRKGSRKHHRLS